MNEINFLCKIYSIDELKEEYDIVSKNIERLQNNLLEGSLFDIAEIDRLIKIQNLIKVRLTELGD